MRPLLSRAALCLAGPALGADIEASSHIESVTLYPRKRTELLKLDKPPAHPRGSDRNF